MEFIQVHKFKLIMANSKPQRVKIFECTLPRGWEALAFFWAPVPHKCLAGGAD